MAITKSLTGAISEGAGAAMFRNRIINGDMRIDQRNAGASITTGVGSNYAVDRFSTWTAVASKFTCLLYTSPSPRDRTRSRMPSSA